jgi:hypothetical protein
MRTKFKPSISSRTSVRGLIIACMPAAALGVIANSPALGAVFNPSSNQGLTGDDNAAASTNGASHHAPSTNSTDTPHFDNDVPTVTAGLRG